MVQRLSDARLRALTDVRCPACERDAAQGTGNARHAAELGQWLVEYSCLECEEAFWSWRPVVDAHVRKIVLDHEARARPRSVAVSGEIGDDGPVVRRAAPERPPPAQDAVLLRIHDSASDLASAMRRPFVFTVEPSGALVHQEEPTPGPFCSSLVRKTADAPAVLGPLRDLLARAGLAGLPAEFGRGAALMRIAWYGAGAPQLRTLRWTRSGTTREWGGEPVTRELVDLVDGLLDLLHWVDDNAPDPAWPGPELRHFPDPDDLVHRRRAARLSVTHDWNGPSRHATLRQVLVSDAGLLRHRTIRLTGARPILESDLPDELPPREVHAIVEQLARLAPAKLRRKIGFSSGDCGLDTTHTHTLDYFDGVRVHTTTFVFGTERGLGVAYGDAPPNAAESAAFKVLGDLMRRA